MISAPSLLCFCILAFGSPDINNIGYWFWDWKFGLLNSKKVNLERSKNLMINMEYQTTISKE